MFVRARSCFAQQLFDDLTPTDPDFFYAKRDVLASPPYPEAAEIRGTKSNITDLHDADIVITNIQQLQRDGNKWLAKFDADYFDLIQFDEGHHNVAESWDILRDKFPNARIINVSATPSRADGRLMSGQIIYVYPISQAVKNGYVKRITGHRLNPKTLKYVRREGDEEVTVDLDEVRRLGETDAGFRRSIVSSEETLSTIVDASIHKLNERRKVTGERRLKIIASALNMEHCKQIVAAYTARSLRADFVHSKQDGKANERVHEKLENHELDVIVQVRKLGEGFDHPFLTVAAVFSIFSNLSPFMQFVGRVMRIIPDSDPHSDVNEGIVVFHVGGNITGVWNDFRDFADADQEFLMNLVDE
jgi:superfamily II DNA or RNA helicase